MNIRNYGASLKAVKMSHFIKFRTAIFIFLCILLGGTSQAIFLPKIILCTLSAFIIGFYIHKTSIRNLASQTKFIASLTVIFIIYAIVQLIPLPPSIWTALPGRELYVQSFDMMEMPLPWLPIAMVPGDVLKSLLNILPALAVFLLVSQSSNWTERNIAIWAILLAATLSLLLGGIQVLTGDKGFYIYKITNSSAPVGLFSNVNHNATLLSVALSFAISMTLAYWFRRNKRHNHQKDIGVIISASLSFLFIIGLLLNGSSAGYVLLFITIIFMILSFSDIQDRSNLRWFILIGVFLLALILIDFFFLGTAQRNFAHSLLDDASTSRQEIVKNSWEVIKTSFPWGTGLGSFREVYPAYEIKSAVTHIFAPHVHNDILEFILEMGLIGFGLIVGLMLWWAQSLKNIFKLHNATTQHAKAAALILLLIFVHSFVDYPLRTLTISSVAGFCMGLIHIAQFENKFNY